MHIIRDSLMIALKKCQTQKEIVYLLCSHFLSHTKVSFL